MQFWVIADALALFTALADKSRHAAIDEIAIGKKVAIHLRAHLQRVAPIHEHRSFVSQHDRGARGTGEARGPGEAIIGRGHIFVLPFILVRHDETVQAGGFQRFSQAWQVLTAKGGTARIVIGLEHVLRPLRPRFRAGSVA